MKKTCLIIAAAALAVTATAETWTLERCIDYAIEHNITVKQQQVAQYQGEIDVTAAKDAFLPQASGYASQSWNFGRGLTADNTYAHRNTSSFSVGAQLSLPLFQGLRAVRSLDYSKTALRALVEQVAAAKDDVTLNVIAAYLQALYAGEVVVVQQKNLEVSQRELDRRQALLDAGKLAELDIYQARSQVAQDSLSLTNAEGQRTLALLDLTQLLNLPSADAFDVVLMADSDLPILNADDVYHAALASNHLIKALELNRMAADKNVSVAQSGYIPTLSFNAGIGTNYYKTTGLDNSAFGEQMRQNFAQQIGFSLSVPLFDGLSTRNNVRRARAQQLSADLQLDDTRLQLYKAIQQAYTQALTSEKNFRAATSSAAAAQEAFNAMQIKYDNGRANATELEKAKSDYFTALADQVQAKYERILRARILAFYNKN